MNWQYIFLAIIPGLTYLLIFFSYLNFINFKRTEINKLLSGQVLKNYVKAYGPLKEKELFHHYFSKKSYFLPIFLNIISVFLVIIVFLFQKNNVFNDPGTAIKIMNNLSASAVAGFMGAYLWGHFEMLQRFAINDLNPMVFYRIWLGFWLSGILGQIIGYSMVAPLNIITAFGFGAIPMKGLFEFVKEKTAKQLNINAKEQECEKPNLQFLQGMNQNIRERLEEEDILTAQNLSLANPIKLLMKTNIEWTIILDLIDQAILYNYFGQKLLILRELGIRCAMEITNLTDKDFCSSIGGDITSKQLITTVAARLNWEECLLLNVINNLTNDQQLNFIWELWYEDFSSLDKEELEINKTPSLN